MEVLVMVKVREITEINGRKFAILVNDNDMTACEAVEIDGKWEIDFDYPSIGVDSFDVAAALDFDGANKAGYRFTDNPRC
jgi:hypothetical protein